MNLLTSCIYERVLKGYIIAFFLQPLHKTLASIFEIGIQSCG